MATLETMMGNSAELGFVDDSLIAIEALVLEEEVADQRRGDRRRSQQRTGAGTLRVMGIAPPEEDNRRGFDRRLTADRRDDTWEQQVLSPTVLG